MIDPYVLALQFYSKYVLTRLKDIFATLLPYILNWTNMGLFLDVTGASILIFDILWVARKGTRAYYHPTGNLQQGKDKFLYKPKFLLPYRDWRIIIAWSLIIIGFILQIIGNSLNK